MRKGIEWNVVDYQHLNFLHRFLGEFCDSKAVCGQRLHLASIVQILPQVVAANNVHVALKLKILLENHFANF